MLFKYFYCVFNTSSSSARFANIKTYYTSTSLKLVRLCLIILWSGPEQLPVCSGVCVRCTCRLQWIVRPALQSLLAVLHIVWRICRSHLPRPVDKSWAYRFAWISLKADTICHQTWSIVFGDPLDFDSFLLGWNRDEILEKGNHATLKRNFKGENLFWMTNRISHLSVGKKLN